MPRGDRTGPEGFGPMTGRAAGYCAGYPAPGFANPWPGRAGAGGGGAWGRGGFGGGGGRGRRHRHWYYATGQPGWMRWGAPAYAAEPLAYPPVVPPTAQQQAEYLETQAEWLKDQVGAIERQIAELKTAGAQKTVQDE